MLLTPLTFAELSTLSFTKRQLGSCFKLGSFEGWVPMPDGVAAGARQREQLIYEEHVMSFGGGDGCDGTPRRRAAPAPRAARPRPEHTRVRVPQKLRRPWLQGGRVL